MISGNDRDFGFRSLAMWPLRLGMQLGLFQLSLGILGVLILGLLSRLIIQDIQLPAVLAALAVVVSS